MTDNSANPAPLGLLGFGMTTILLNLHNVGFFGIGTMILAMGIFYGGIAQVLAGLLEFKKGNTFGMTAFTSYGMFWLSLVAIFVMKEFGLWSTAPTDLAMASYLFMWGLLTLFLFIGTLKNNKVLQAVFGSLVILFWLLALGDFTGIAIIKIIAGYVGIICGLLAFYLAVAEVLNEVYKKELLPIWAPKA